MAYPCESSRSLTNPRSNFLPNASLKSEYAFQFDFCRRKCGLGPNLVPDYLTSVKEGGFYGWPFSYYGKHLDPRVMPQRPDLVAKAIVPDYALSSHVAPLGMTFYAANSLPQKYRGGAFVGEHGSWNRLQPNGYKVVSVPFKDGRPNGKAEDVVTDFLNSDGEARGRPVGVAVDGAGALLIADDAGNTVWRVTKSD
jgi:glucose/arabinose dehydrogenase